MATRRMNNAIDHIAIIKYLSKLWGPEDIIIIKTKKELCRTPTLPY